MSAARDEEISAEIMVDEVGMVNVYVWAIFASEVSKTEISAADDGGVLVPTAGVVVVVMA